MKFPKLLLVIAVLFLSVMALNGQTAATSKKKAITEADFEKIDNKAKELLKTTSYRLTKPDKKWVEEHVPPDRKHIISEYTQGGKKKRFELIIIGELRFEKKDNGAWAKAEEPRGYHETVGPANPVSVKYFLQDPVRVDGHKVTPIEVVKTMKFRIGRKDVLSRGKNTYWFDTEGRLVKRVAEGYSVLPGSRRLTEIYEYDPNIKIEVPIK